MSYVGTDVAEKIQNKYGEKTLTFSSQQYISRVWSLSSEEKRCAQVSPVGVAGQGVILSTGVCNAIGGSHAKHLVVVRLGEENKLILATSTREDAQRTMYISRFCGRMLR